MTLIPKGQKVQRIKPKRAEYPDHLDYVASQRCCCCGVSPVVVHHLLRGDPKRGMNRKADDNYTIPLCPTCHIALHNDGNEARFLAKYCVDGQALAAKLWSESNA